MNNYYFPGCKYKAHNPEGSERLARYLNERFGIIVMDCCSVGFDTPAEEDTVFFQCPTCGLILHDSGSQRRLRSVYRLLSEDDRFPWPDHSGRQMTLQDCWRSREDDDYLQAVRDVLAKMNIHPLELPNCREKADFCGATLYRVPSGRYHRLAPVSLVEKACFDPQPEEVQQQLMKEHGKLYRSEDELCNCTGCLEGIRMAGHTPVHVLDLITDALR